MERLKEASYEDRHRVEKTYKEKLRAMDGRIRAVRSKERRLAQVERLQERSMDKCARLQADIQGIKTQKVPKGCSQSFASATWPTMPEHHMALAAARTEHVEGSTGMPTSANNLTSYLSHLCQPARGSFPLELHRAKGA